MASLAVLKKKLAALEAQVERVTKAEMGSAISKIHKIMADFGLTIEHLAAGLQKRAPTKRGAARQAAAKSKGARPPKYQDSKSGATWSGLGRIPAWIANSKNRDAFLIARAPVAAAEPEAKIKRAPAKKRAKAASTSGEAAPKAVAAKKPSAKRAVAGKRAAAKTIATDGAPKASARPAAKKAVAPKVRRKSGATLDAGATEVQAVPVDTGASAA